MINPLTQLVRNALDRDSDRPALEFEGRWYSWGAFSALASELREGLAASGIAASAPVAFVARNRPGAVAALFGLIADQRTILMTYPFQAHEAIAANLLRLEPAAVVAVDGVIEGAVLDMLRENALPAFEIEGMSVRRVADIPAPPAVPLGEPPAEPEIRILTSGTTGMPKQIPFAYRFFEEKHVTPKMVQGDDAHWREQPPFLLTFPIGNITGMYTFLPTLLSGQRAVLADRFSLDVWRDWVRRFRPAMAGLPPAGVQMIVDADVPREELASIRFLGTGAAPLDPTVQRRFEERYGIPILLSYGATEFGGPVTAMTPELHARWGREKLGSVGRPMAGVEMRVIHPETHEILSAGEEGLLEVMTPRIGPRWIRTSDMALIDADGFVWHRGRADGAVMRGGFKLVPEVIERAMMQHPDIADVAVVGRDDRRLGEVPVAAVVLRPGSAWPGNDALEAFARKHLPATHIPADWRQLDALPRNASSKLDRPELRRMVA
ncbi:class I adenylate-forming enzyme family protein [Stakelama tenebrarum]|uniref:AMP-binding protein n=1 Tax=Stakelama tenebrarum TaxID=2711215 RepID=A0A6G6Y7T9_9SPHN|nr:long-chain fatty acid--CoA ligase [Sphingosinithalassobacter tenebrarum]QIG80979.1 AMP-binding protein [Sphingosinithalassobacter tenebrarum]